VADPHPPGPDAVDPRNAGLVNVANALTVVRLLLVPVFVVFLVEAGHPASTGWRLAALAAFGVASLTDLLDGQLARSRGLVTDFGKIADPIADKAMTGMAFIGLSIIGELWWWVTIVVLIRELGVTIARLSIAKHVVIAASQSGKLKTLTQVFALGGFIGPFKHLSGAWEVPGDVVWWVSAVLMGVAVVLTITSGLEFARDAVKQRRAARAVH
jgi:CDP-diacylglycerol---glycerol-3-phosphate 3-phosphatidyltransferase